MSGTWAYSTKCQEGTALLQERGIKMHIVMNCGKSGKYFALTEGAVCAGAHYAYGWGDTPRRPSLVSSQTSLGGCASTSLT